MKTIKLNATVTASNDRDADALRARLRQSGTLLVNVMSSPGAGKTTLLSRLIRDLEGLRIAVLEADIASDVDAKRIEALGARAIQVHTSGMCHMDAGMTAAALEALGLNLPCLQGRGTGLKAGGGVRPDDGSPSGGGCKAGGRVRPNEVAPADRGVPSPFDLIFLENVGNLICPAEYDTGASLNLMLLSIPEGDDKPLKYPLMFQKSDALIVTKTDTLGFFDFDLSKCEERAKKLNPNIQIFPVSAKTGEGMDRLEAWLEKQLTGDR